MPSDDMTTDDLPDAAASPWDSVGALEQRLKDYVGIGRKLIWQRQAIFLAATILGTVYFDPTLAIVCYLGVLTTEIMTASGPGTSCHSLSQSAFGVCISLRMRSRVDGSLSRAIKAEVPPSWAHGGMKADRSLNQAVYA